jgi:DNA-binding protein YbaB
MSDIEEAEIFLHDWNARLQEKAEKTRALAARVGEVTASAESAYGVVRVTVNNSGIPTSITVDDEGAASWAPSRVAHEILTTMRRAQSRLTETVEEIVGQSADAGSEVGRTLLAGYYREFPQRPDAEATA